MPAAVHPSALEMAGVVAALGSVPVVWWTSVALSHRSGIHPILGHLVGFVLSPVAFLAVFALFVLGDAVALILMVPIALVLGGTYLVACYKSPSMIGVAEPRPASTAPHAAAPQCALAQPTEAAHPSEPEAITAARRDSLAAMKRAAVARKKDMEIRGEVPDMPLYAGSVASALSAREAFAEIEFDYRDAQGNESHRHVSVEAVDDEYFEGFCHQAMDTRTFVIGRVRGKIVDLDTGELLSPKKWAATARKDPRNTGVIESRSWKAR